MSCRCFGLISSDLIELEGEPHLLNLFHGLTARFATEEALRDSQERYRQLFELYEQIRTARAQREAYGRQLEVRYGELMAGRDIPLPFVLEAQRS